MSLSDIASAARLRHLDVVGALHPDADPDVPNGTQTLVLLGPSPESFWDKIRTETEFTDAQADPLDRWSRRVIGRWACDLGAKALFPFGGPPYRPFLRWAVASGRAWSSPTGPLVHDTMGMMISYRGALALRDRLDLPPPPATAPCATCKDQPCRAACPIGALSPVARYDVPGCKAYLRADPDGTCHAGCLTRRACPISDGAGRQPDQSRFHMSNFLRTP